MKPRIVIVAALAVLLVGLMLFRPSAQLRTELSPANTAIVVAPDEPTSHLNTIRAATPMAQVEGAQTTNLMALLLKGELPTLTPDQLKTYLEANHRDAESLLAAYQATHERALLDEAIAKYPNDPRVAFAAWFRSPSAGDPDALQARRQALDVLKQAAPDNALANYLSAANYFKAGQPELALQELQAAAAKPRYNDYTQDAIQSMEEAYRAAGYSDVESKAAATSSALLPHLAEMKQAGLSLVELANSYQQAGDPASAQAALQMCLDLGQRLDDPNSLTLIQPLVGNAIQRAGLAAMAAAAPDADTAQAIQDRLNALNQQRAGIKALVTSQPIETWLPNAPSEDANAYFDRMRLFGEQRALQWLATRR